MHSLPIFVRLQGRRVILLGSGDAADAKRRLLERAGAIVATDADTHAALAIVAIEDEAEARGAIAQLKSRGVLVNAVDRPDDCDFTLPAIVDRDPVIIAIGTGGASAGLAKHVRQRLEVLLPATLGGLAAALGKARNAMRTCWPDATERRRALDAALREGGVLDPLGQGDAGAVNIWLTKGVAAPQPRVEHILLASNEPDELTLRVARLLGEADVIASAVELPPAIARRARADARLLVTPTAPPPSNGLTLWITLPTQV